MPDDLMPVAPPLPEVAHLDEPDRWIITGPHGSAGNPTVQATAMSIVDDWLILWRYTVIVAAYRPGTYNGAYCAGPSAIDRYAR